jgi:hypothetical protein
VLEFSKAGFAEYIALSCDMKDAYLLRYFVWSWKARRTIYWFCLIKFCVIVYFSIEIFFLSCVPFLWLRDLLFLLSHFLTL